jgi:hypothetical protein
MQSKVMSAIMLRCMTGISLGVGGGGIGSEATPGR